MDERNQSLMTAKGGEAHVMSCLLFHGFNANILTVDSGIDIAAIKEGGTYLFQIKTRHWNRNSIRISLELDALKRYKDERVYFVLVARDRETERIQGVILSADHLIKVQKMSRIRQNQRGRDSLLLIFSRRRDGGVTLNNGGRVDKYIDIWDKIEKI